MTFSRLIKQIWCFIAFSALYFSSFSTFADSFNLHWQKQHLPQTISSYFLTVNRTDDGFHWLGGTSGLIRFDALSFKNVPFILADGSEKTVSPTVLALAPGDNNQLWIGTTEGLFLYDPERLVANEVSQLKPSPIKRLSFTQGVLFGLSFADGVFSLNAGEARYFNPGKSSTLYDDMALDKRYLYMLGKDNVVEIYNKKTKALVNSKLLGEGQYSRIHLLENGLWFSGESVHLAKLTYDDWIVDSKSLPVFSVAGASVINDKQLLLLDKNGTEFYFDSETQKLEKGRQLIDQKGHSINVDVRKLTRLSDGRIWILGNKPNELYRQDTFAGAFAIADFNGEVPQSIKDLKFARDGILYGSSEAGLYRQPAADKPFELVAQGNFDDIVGFSDNRDSADKSIWLFGADKYLYRVELAQGKRTKLGSQSCNSLVQQPIYIDQIAAQKWLMFDGNSGVVEIVPGNCRQLTETFRITPGLDGKSIYDVYQLKAGHYLVSTTWGLFQYHLGANVLSPWREPGLSETYNLKPVLNFGQAWGGVLMPEHGGKLNAYFPDKKRFSEIGFKPFPGDHVVELGALDGPGLLVGSERGIYLHGPSSNRFWPLDGMLDGKPLKRNQLAITTDELALVINQRVYRLAIEQLKTIQSNLPQAYLSTLSINQQLQQPRPDNDYLQKSLSYAPSLELSYRDAFVSIGVSALGDGLMPFDFEYRLIGLGDDWIGLKGQERIHLTSLPAGTYRLQVRTANSLGSVSNQIDELRIKVLPPPWWSWQAKLFYLLLSLLVVLGLLQMQKVKHREMQTTLENKVNERTESLNQAVADLQQKQEQISALLSQKEHLIDEKDTLLAAISHELKTPLATLEGPLALMADGKAKQAELLPVMQRSTDRIKRFVEQILLLAKLGEQSPIEKHWLPLNRLVGHVVQSYQDFAARHEVILQSEIEPSIDIYGGVQTLEILVSNLLSNAVVHGKSGGNVLIKLELIEDEAKVSVVDTGRGMDEKARAMLFKPFSSGGQGGSGLGMALAQQIVTAHDGRIDVQSSPGQGCTIDVYLPAAKRSETAEQYQAGEIVLPAAGLASQTQALEGKPAVLVVDDEADILVLLTVVLGQHYQLYFAQDGEQAKLVLEEQPIAIVLCDQHMPNMTGTELTDWVKENPSTSHIPVVIISADVDSKTQESALKHMADAFLSKPFDYQVLMAQMDSLLQNRARITAAELVTLDSNPVEEEGQQNSDQKFMTRLLQLMEDNYKDPEFKLSEHLADFSMSERNLRYKINALTGESPSNYLYQFRLEKAKLLLESDLSMEQIALNNGFKNVRQFRKRFVEYIGMSPSEMRAQLMAD